MLMDLGDGVSVNIHDIESITTESVESAADFKYHPVTVVRTRNGTKLKTTMSEAEVRDKIADVCPTSPVLDRDVPEPITNPLDGAMYKVPFNNDSDAPSGIEKLLEDHIAIQKQMVAEVQALREIVYRVICLAENGDLQITIKNANN